MIHVLTKSQWSIDICTHLLYGNRLLLSISLLESRPSLLRRPNIPNTVQGEETISFAIGSDMTFLLASTAELRSLLRTISLAVAGLATATALAGELALDGRVRAVRLVVAGLVAVVAEAGVGAFLPRFRAVAREVAFGAAAGLRVSGRGARMMGLCRQLTCGRCRCRRRRAWRRSGRGNRCPHRLGPSCHWWSWYRR